MHPSKTPTTGPVDRRDFLKTGIAVVVGATAAGTRRAASEEPASVPDQITTRAFGKTGRTLPILLVDHESRLPCGTRNTLSGRPFRSSCDEYSARVLSERIAMDFAPEEQADIYVEAARAAVAVNDLNKAVDCFLKASNLTTTNTEQAEELLGVLIAAKQTKLAVQVLQQLDRSDQVLRRIVDVYEMANQPEEAVPELEELCRGHPDDARVVCRLAELAVVRGDFTAAVHDYRTLRNLEPKNENARIKLADTMLLLARDDLAAGRFDAAQSLFDESFKLQPPDDELKREYGGLLAQAGRFDEAVGILELLTDTDSQRQLAAVLEMQGNRPRALRILLDLEKSHALEDQAERSIARLLLANREYAEAAERLVRLLQQEPDDLELQRELIS